ncbi:hypothetical protein SARC_04416 [Sphaeroforma arctica JP610]|uniref:Uncharacterized protein n=1 Tax=Sphaeroforma arctica JP610 TaxID=667725 RepID=A0A0L0G2L1_9EUKA|nr:hypothetical protein SARC_04416 [Sphaeroforma arctica JP610]KNC83320.1 hypothetical protein SARC_04416 [Sphaeroforma arctica JP610]|eukprot:XP_014157222.1 hypothetical protein SARC_04416 [Sphaeroforma arctica JP610]
MGKAKNNKKKPQRKSPLPMPTADEVMQDAEQTASHDDNGNLEGELLDLTIKLKQTENIEARVYACGSIAYMLSQASSDNKIYSALVQSGSLLTLVELLDSDDHDLRLVVETE